MNRQQIIDEISEKFKYVLQYENEPLYEAIFFKVIKPDRNTQYQSLCENIVKEITKMFPSPNLKITYGKESGYGYLIKIQTITLQDYIDKKQMLLKELEEVQRHIDNFGKVKDKDFNAIEDFYNKYCI